MTFTPTRINAATLVKVEVLGLPKSSRDPVFTYRLSADACIGDLVLVPTPAWAVDVVLHESLPGYVLGTASLDELPEGVAIRDTLPLYGPESNSHGLLVAEARETITRWRRQSQSLSKIARLIDEAADELERAMG